MSENSFAYRLPSNVTSTNSTNTEQFGCLYSADSRLEKTMKVTAYSTILLVSLIGNALIILVFFKHKPIQRSINYFVVNMAFSDLLSPLTIMPLKIAEVLSGSSAFLIHTPLALGNALCTLTYFLPDVSVFVSIQSLLLISLDRLVAVVFPLKAKLITSKMRWAGIACTWIVAMSVHAPYFSYLRLSYEENKRSYSCLHHWPTTEKYNAYVSSLFISFVLVPVCILLSIYSTIAVTLHRRHGERQTMSSNCSGSAHVKTRSVIGLSLAILAASILCLGPSFVLMCATIFVWNWAPPPALVCSLPKIEFFVLFTWHSWSALNPCTCFAFSKKYRHALRSSLNGLFSRRSDGSISTSTKMTSVRRTARKSSSARFDMMVIEKSTANVNGIDPEKKTNERTYLKPEQTGRKLLTHLANDVR